MALFKGLTVEDLELFKRTAMSEIGNRIDSQFKISCAEWFKEIEELKAAIRELRIQVSTQASIIDDKTAKLESCVLASNKSIEETEAVMSDRLEEPINSVETEAKEAIETINELAERAREKIEVAQSNVTSISTQVCASLVASLAAQQKNENNVVSGNNSQQDTAQGSPGPTDVNKGEIDEETADENEAIRKKIKRF